MSAELDRLLREASEILGCANVSIRCDCPNLETVYVEREGDHLLVGDRGSTYAYLNGGTDTVFDIELLTEEKARGICEQNGVDLYVSQDAELLPRIQRAVTDVDDLPAVVESVATAIDEIFTAAERPAWWNTPGVEPGK